MRTLLLIIVSLVPGGFSSWGDSSPEYRNCLQPCIRNNCTNPSGLGAWRAGQSLPEYVVGWTCQEDCGYMCTWKATDSIRRRTGRVPQFHGRWPFLRLFGMQEPASVLFSLLNLLSHLYMISWFRKLVPQTAPMYSVWTVNAVVSINAWIWSAVFHTRDTPFTEMMDYFCAFSTVLFSLLVFFLRVLVHLPEVLPKIGVTLGFLGFYAHHVYKMATHRFDYGYNMKVNVLVGGLNCVCWLVWFYANRGLGSHIKQGTFTILALTLSVCLELLEFTPVLWSIDSHALWHLFTAPLPLLWYKFAAADSLYLVNSATSPSLQSPTADYKKSI